MKINYFRWARYIIISLAIFVVFLLVSNQQSFGKTEVKIVNHPIVQDSPSSLSSEPHFFGRETSFSCSTQMSVPLDNILQEGGSVNFDDLSVGAETSKNFQICIAPHLHHHRIMLQTYSMYGSCHIYASLRNSNPSIVNWDWKANGKRGNSLNLMTYLVEFAPNEWNSLYVSVSSNIPSSCKLSMKIVEIPTEEILQKVGTLRGQVLLPRDVAKMMNSQ